MKYSQANKKQFTFSTKVYEYSLLRQDRKTLSLSVTPDLQIFLKSPLYADTSRIEKFLQRKWTWLEKQLTFFKKHQKKFYQKEYISGESFLYLGKQYKLIVKHSRKDEVFLTKDIMQVFTTANIYDSKYTKKLLDNWYKEMTDKIFNERFEHMKLKFDYNEYPILNIREMKNRWGSYLKSGKVLLNPKLINTSKDCIDYVIAHELCHVKYKSHNKFFYALLSEKCFRWKKIKEKLELLGAEICY